MFQVSLLNPSQTPFSHMIFVKREKQEGGFTDRAGSLFMIANEEINRKHPLASVPHPPNVHVPNL